MGGLLEGILVPFLSLIVGGIITSRVAKRYYEKASMELSEETRRLKQLNDLQLRAMESAGFVKVIRDKSGEVSGLTYQADVTL
jgi:hypothetical protein